MAYVNVNTYTPPMWCVIDKDTGTVLGMNVVLVPVHPDVMHDILDSDSEARMHAEKYGIPLMVEED